MLSIYGTLRKQRFCRLILIWLLVLAWSSFSAGMTWLQRRLFRKNTIFSNLRYFQLRQVLLEVVVFQWRARCALVNSCQLFFCQTFLLDQNQHWKFSVVFRREVADGWNQIEQLRSEILQWPRRLWIWCYRPSSFYPSSFSQHHRPERTLPALFRGNSSGCLSWPCVYRASQSLPASRLDLSAIEKSVASIYRAHIRSTSPPGPTCYKQPRIPRA